MSKAYNNGEGEVIGKMNPEEYWEWRHAVLNMQSSEMKTKNKNLLQQMMFKDIEVKQLKANLMKYEVDRTRAAEQEAKNEYHEVRNKIGKRLGIELEGCIIDDITYEIVKDTPNDKEVIENNKED